MRKKLGMLLGSQHSDFFKPVFKTKIIAGWVLPTLLILDNSRDVSLEIKICSNVPGL